MKAHSLHSSEKLRFTMALLAFISGTVTAQTYTKTETITYDNNTTKWILGQTTSVTDLSTGLVQSAQTYDVTYSMPIARSVFGKLQHTLTYNTGATLPSGLRGTLSTVKDGNNNVTTLSSWKRGIPQSIAYPDSTSQAALVNDSGWLEWVTDEIAARTCYTYDSMGRLSGITYTSETVTDVCDTSKWSSTTRALVSVATSEFGIPAGHWRETVTTGNAVKNVYFDGMWRPLLVREYDTANSSGTERFTKFSYDLRGRQDFKSYPSTTSTPTTGLWTDYDPLGRVNSVTQDSELGPLTSLNTYNTGFTTTVTNPRSKPTTSTYMTYDQPSTDWPMIITGQESATTTITRDVFGKLGSLTRSGNGATATRSYVYYPTTQELCKVKEPETLSTVFGYDLAGNLSWSAAGVYLTSTTACEETSGLITPRKVNRIYDARNRLTDLTFPDGNGTQHWTYTNDGLPSNVTTSNSGNTVSNAYTYNNRRLLSGESMVPDTLQTGWGVGYGYNSLGQVTTEASPASVQVSYTVNALGQTTQTSVGVPSLSTNTVVASNASYYPNGALKQFTYGNGIVHTMTQNARQLPSRSTDGIVLDLGTSFDANGNVTAVTDYTSAARQTKAMVYDNLDRLSSATSPMFGTASYTYDTLDNLKTLNVASAPAAYGVNRSHTYVYDANNRLTNVMSGGSSVIGLAYDVQGNLSNKNSTGYTFDYGNRLRTTAGLTYRYDADGRRVRLDNAGAQLKYSYYAKDGRLVWQRDEPAGKRINNVYFAGSLVAEFSRPIGANTETLIYLHTDALGSPIAKTNSVGTPIETSEYEPYGDLLNRPNDDRAGYTGHVMDAASGLTYMQQRYYDPQLGKMLSVDPVTADGGDMRHFNRYAYAFNNPYKFTDPDGRAGQVAAGGFIGGLIGGGLELYKQVRAGEGISVRAVAVETGRGALIGMATSIAGPAGFAAAKAAQLSTAAAVTTEVTAAGMTAGYATLATGPASDVLKGGQAQSLMSHGPEAAAAMKGTVAGGLVGKAIGGALSKASGQSSVAVGAAARAAEETTSVAVSNTAGQKQRERPPESEVRRKP